MCQWRPGQNAGAVISIPQAGLGQFRLRTGDLRVQELEISIPQAGLGQFRLYVGRLPSCVTFHFNPSSGLRPIPILT